MDMLLSTGEQISIALCAMALEGMGLSILTTSFTFVPGFFSRLDTTSIFTRYFFASTSAYSDARIQRIDSERIQQELDKNKIVLVAGFQGVNRCRLYKYRR